MSKPNGFFTTKVLIEVEVVHQFSPEQGIDIVTGNLNFPAIESVKVISAKTNYALHSDPLDKFVDVELDKDSENK